MEIRNSQVKLTKNRDFNISPELSQDVQNILNLIKNELETCYNTLLNSGFTSTQINSIKAQINSVITAFCLNEPPNNPEEFKSALLTSVSEVVDKLAETMNLTSLQKGALKSLPANLSNSINPKPNNTPEETAVVANYNDLGLSIVAVVKPDIELSTPVRIKREPSIPTVPEDDTDDSFDIDGNVVNAFYTSRILQNSRLIIDSLEILNSAKNIDPSKLIINLDDLDTSSIPGYENNAEVLIKKEGPEAAKDEAKKLLEEELKPLLIKQITKMLSAQGLSFSDVEGYFQQAFTEALTQAVEQCVQGTEAKWYRRSKSWFMTADLVLTCTTIFNKKFNELLVRATDTTKAEESLKSSLDNTHSVLRSLENNENIEGDLKLFVEAYNNAIKTFGLSESEARDLLERVFIGLQKLYSSEDLNIHDDDNRGILLPKLVEILNSEIAILNIAEQGANLFDELRAEAEKISMSTSEESIEIIVDFVNNNYSKIKQALVKQGFSEDYIRLAIGFTLRHCDSTEDTDLEAFISMLELLTSKPEQLTSESEDLPDAFISERGISFYGAGYKTRNWQDFFGDILLNAASKFGISKADEPDFLQKLIKVISDKIGVTRLGYCGRDISGFAPVLAKITDFNYYLNFEDLEKLDTNNGTWLDEFFTIANDVAKNFKTNENVTGIDLDALFGGKQSLTAEDLYNNLYELSVCDDPGVRKFAQLLEDLLIKFNDKFYDAKETSRPVIENLIKLINKKLCGDTSGSMIYSSVLSRDALALFQTNTNLFDEIEELANTDEFYRAVMLNIDGEIDDFSQGNENDCWLLSELKALTSSEAGKNLIKNAIKWSDDYSEVTVYFAGENKYVTLSAEEILKYMEERKLSNGDNDVLVIEMAFQKLYGDIGGNLKTALFKNPFFEMFVGAYDIDKKTAGGLDDLGRLIGGWIGIGSGKTDIKEKNVIKFLENVYKNKLAGKNFAFTFALFTSSGRGDTWSANTVDGERWEFSMDSSGHEFAITNITANTVTFVDPHDSSKSYTVTWSDFAKIGIAQLKVAYF